VVKRAPAPADDRENGEEGQRSAPGCGAFGEPGAVFKRQLAQEPKPVFGRGLRLI
jgi:hypothetical protein